MTPSIAPAMKPREFSGTEAKRHNLKKVENPCDDNFSMFSLQQTLGS
jgi:hypothetical protein